MDSREEIKKTKLDHPYEVDKLIGILQSWKSQGATHIDFEIPSDDQPWPFRWIIAYRQRSDDELRKAKIAEHKAEIERLEADGN